MGHNAHCVIMGKFAHVRVWLHLRHSNAGMSLTNTQSARVQVMRARKVSSVPRVLTEKTLTSLDAKTVTTAHAE